MASVNIDKTLEYLAVGRWSLSVSITGSQDAPTDVFIVSRKKYLINSYEHNQSSVVAHPILDINATGNLIPAWRWSPQEFLRVATREDLTAEGMVDPSALPSEDYLSLVPVSLGGTSELSDFVDTRSSYPYDASHSPYITLATGENSTQVAGTHPLGTHKYRTNTFTKEYPTWEKAEGAYAGIRALVGALVNPEAGKVMALRLTTPAGIPRRNASVPYSMYPGDKVHFIASGGTGTYQFSILDVDGSGSSISSDGIFTASVPQQNPLTEYLVTVKVTDLDVSDGEVGNQTIAVKVIQPDNLNTTTTISTGDYV